MLQISGRERRTQILCALDRSLRSIDADGHMRVEESRISKANICPYKGREIPNWQALGLDPDRTYRLFRDPKELEKAAPTFEGKPLLIRHEPIDAGDPKRELWVGTIGQVTWEAPYLVARPLTVLTAEAIKLIESRQQRELSSAYRYDADMQPGAWGGQQYDGRMVNIRGNHVAIVSEGRVGPDVHVADSNPTEFRRMKTLSATIAAVIASCLPAGTDTRRVSVALDGMLGETPAESVISLDAEEMKACEDSALEEKRKAEGADAELDDKDREAAYEKARDRKRAKDKRAKDKAAKDAKDSAAQDKKARDEREDAMDAREAAMDEREAASDGESDEPEAKDRKAARDKRAADRAKRASDRGAKDANPDHRRDFNSIKQGGADAVTKDELSEAVRGAVEAERARSRDAAVAREKVRPIVGVVSVALDSAPEIYRFALKHAKVSHDGVHDSALGALVDMAVERSKPKASPAIAQDAVTSNLTDINALFGPQAN
jgi:hypothetical protein